VTGGEIDSRFRFLDPDCEFHDLQNSVTYAALEFAAPLKTSSVSAAEISPHPTAPGFLINKTKFHTCFWGFFKKLTDRTLQNVP
jgi:hypothetical protein